MSALWARPRTRAAKPTAIVVQGVALPLPPPGAALEQMTAFLAITARHSSCMVETPELDAIHDDVIRPAALAYLKRYHPDLARETAA